MTETEIMDLAANVGLCLLENGAETQRVEDTVMRILSHFTDDKSDVIVTLTGITISVGSYTKAVRVRVRGINLNKIAKLNLLSREIAESSLSFEDAVNRLKMIRREKPYPFWVKTLAFGICCGFFTLLFGGGTFDAVNGFVTGVILNCASEIFSKHISTPFLITLLEGAVVSLSALTISLFLPCKNAELAIIGSIMPLVPGLELTNAMRDLSYGDYLSGGSRFFSALITSLAVAAGAGGATHIWRFLAG